MRTVPEWIGKTDDEKVPTRVRLTEADILARSQTEATTGCWLWDRGVQSSGYGCWHVAGRNALAHRVAYEIMHGAGSSAGHVVCHQCDTPACVNPSHLFLGDQGANVRDAARKGRLKVPSYRGEGHPAAKLSEDAVRAIRLDPRDHARVAKDHGVSKTTVYEIRARKSWGHVP